MKATLIVLSVLSLTPAARLAAQATVGDPEAIAGQVTASYDALTNDLVEFTNFHPEPFAGIAFDVDGGILAVNPYNNTWIKYASPAATQLSLRAMTGHNPVSIAVWNPGTPAQRRVVVVCTGSHALFLHDPNDGRVLGVLQLDSEPGDLVIHQETSTAFVSCRGKNTVVEIDLPSWTVTRHYPIPGQRPGPLHLDPGDPGVAGDTRVFVACMVTGNNSVFVPTVLTDESVGAVGDLELFGFSLPDEDVYRIDPSQPVATAVSPAVRNAGSLIFELARHPNGELWILSTESNNKDPALDTEPLIKGKIVTNQLKRVAGVGASGAAVDAPDGIDLDDTDPDTPVAEYDAALSVNQVRTLAFQPDGDAFVASPMSSVIARLGPDGKRNATLDLPQRAQCYTLRVYPQNPSIVLALCLGTMTIEVLAEGNPAPNRPLPLGSDPTPASVRRGRDIMFDGQISADGRSSCQACHEGERSDQLGWSIGNPPADFKDVMVTQSLLSIADTFPHHWRGERDLHDFRKAFVGLLGAPASLEPTVEQMDDVNAFIRSLKAPANPIEDYRRIVNDLQSPGPAPNGSFGSAVDGQFSFKTLENFNDNTCAECHTPQNGGNGNMFAEVLTSPVAMNSPRVQEVEVAHLRQLQHKGLETFTIPTIPTAITVNKKGFGATHNGASITVFHFIMETFFQISVQARVDIFKFVEQFDQGIAPGAHWTAWLDDASDASVVTDIEDILIAGAEEGWLECAVFGRYDAGGGAQEVRWLYDPGLDLFVNDHALVPDQTWTQFQAATSAGLAENAFVGLPLGNGFRFAFDPDDDDLSTGAELAAGTNPHKADTDRDGWQDGYEVENGQLPLVPQASPGDTLFPQIRMSRLEFVTARLAKYHARFSEDVRYVVEYSFPSGPTLTFTQPDFVRADTFVLTHSTPSNPDPLALNKPEPANNLVFSAQITMTDRAGNTTGPEPLEDDFQPLAAQFQLGLPGAFAHIESITAQTSPGGPGVLTATVTIEPRSHFMMPHTFPFVRIPPNGQVVFCNIAVEDLATGDFVQSSTFTTNPPLPTSFSVRSFVETPPGSQIFVEVIEPYGATPGPFIVSNPVQNGATQFTFSQGGLVPGQRVKVAVQGLLIPFDLGQQIYDGGSLFNFQPLLTEEFHELVITF